MKKAEHSAVKWMVPDEAEKKRWDKMVMEDPQGNVYSLSWYLDTVAPDKWGLVTNENQTGALPLAFKKRTGYRNVYQPFYTMFFNPVGQTDLDTCVEFIKKDFHHLHFTTEVQPLHLKYQQRVRQELHLKNFTTKVYSENALRQVKKAEKHLLAFSFHENAKEVVDIFRQNKGAELKEYKPADFRTLENLIKKSIEKKHGFCASVKWDHTVLASAFFLTFRNRIIFLKGGLNDQGKNRGAMYFLMHQVMEWARDKYEIFDFGGSNNKNVAEFYRRLGGKDVTYFEIKIDRRNLLHKVMGKLKK